MNLNLTPDPKILVALTHTPLVPLDALCELVDNAIDSFSDARLGGDPVAYPLVAISIPTAADIRRGAGIVQVRDNGPGLSPENTEKALRAGFSGKNSRGGRLGLFGMGFNIATGKLGQRTRFVTSQRSATHALEVEINLPAMQARGSYDVPANDIEKPEGFEHGTIVEVSHWWPDGNPNHAFVRKLASYGTKTVVQELSRRYATILREHAIRIVVNTVSCVPFEHCAWHQSRSVERRGLGQVPARFDFDEVLATQARCADCDALLAPTDSSCPQCSSASRRTVSERVRGWVGIQRFDAPTDFGIDLVRNGRAIRIGEKEAFFTFVDEFKREIKDYPIDGPYGRIIGEVHLDHVPVDFLKQDFQRASDEWQRAMVFLRGTSSFQPQQPNADSNNSMVCKLFRAYRRVRTPGTVDLYMGVWDDTTEKPTRIGRDVEKEYYQRFLAREPGYYDDAEWWRLVESAARQPTRPLVACPHCDAENLPEHTVCQVCSGVIRGQACISAECGNQIPAGSVICPICGVSQIPEIVQPWRCETCGGTNSAAQDTCSGCQRARGEPHPAAHEALSAVARRNDTLSVPNLSVTLSDGSHSQGLEVVCYETSGPILPIWRGEAVPVIAFKGEKLEIFIDRSHQHFRSFRIRPEIAVAYEAAQFVYDLNRALLRPELRGAHSVSSLCNTILKTYWSSTLEDGPGRVRNDIESFFSDVCDSLPQLAKEISRDIFVGLSEESQRELTNNLLSLGRDLSVLGEWSHSGEYLRFVDPSTISGIFQQFPHVFFDGGVWQQAFSKLQDTLQASVVLHVQKELLAQYGNCLADCAAFLRYSHPDGIVTQRARMSLTFLAQKLA